MTVLLAQVESLLASFELGSCDWMFNALCQEVGAHGAKVEVVYGPRDPWLVVGPRDGAKTWPVVPWRSLS